MANEDAAARDAGQRPVDSIVELVAQLELRDPQAAAQLFDRYAERLTRLAEQQLSRRLAGRVEGEDIVQSVFRTFFRRTAEGEFRIDSSGQLWRLLVKITVLKARAKARFHTAAKRDAGKEGTLARTLVPEEFGDGLMGQVASAEPGPEEAVELCDLIEHVLRGLPNLYCQVLELRLQGEAVSHVAAKVGVSRQTIHRMLNLLEERLKDSSAGLT